MSKTIRPRVGAIVEIWEEELKTIFYHEYKIKARLPIYLRPQEKSAKFVVTESAWQSETVDRESISGWRVVVKRLNLDGTYNEDAPELRFYTQISGYYNGPGLLKEGVLVVGQMKQTFV